MCFSLSLSLSLFPSLPPSSLSLSLSVCVPLYAAADLKTKNTMESAVKMAFFLARTVGGGGGRGSRFCRNKLARLYSWAEKNPDITELVVLRLSCKSSKAHFPEEKKTLFNFARENFSAFKSFPSVIEFSWEANNAFTAALSMCKIKS